MPGDTSHAAGVLELRRKLEGWYELSEKELRHRDAPSENVIKSEQKNSGVYIVHLNHSPPPPPLKEFIFCPNTRRSGSRGAENFQFLTLKDEFLLRLRVFNQ